jgi:hypothetical protein
METLRVAVKRTVSGEANWMTIASGEWSPPDDPILDGELPPEVIKCLFRSDFNPDPSSDEGQEVMNHGVYRYEMVWSKKSK